LVPGAFSLSDRVLRSVKCIYCQSEDVREAPARANTASYLELIHHAPPPARRGEEPDRSARRELLKAEVCAGCGSVRLFVDEGDRLWGYPG